MFKTFNKYLNGERNQPATLRHSINDGRAYAAMVGFGESYLSAFGVFLRATPVQLGLLTSLPTLTASLMQFLGVWLMERFQQRKRLIVTGVLLQALIWLPISLIPMVLGIGGNSVTLLIILAACYLASGAVSAPIWSSLIGDLVPEQGRGSFFGARTQQIGIVTFICLLIGGQTLQIAKDWHHEAIGFLLIFLAACISRLVSAFFLSLHEEPEFKVRPETHFSFWDFVRRAPKSNFAKFVFFFASMNAAVSIAGPLFSLYFLSHLKFSYLEFTILVAGNAASQFATLRHWGNISDRYGNKKILNLCAVGVASVPFFYLFSANYWLILCVQLYAGVVWAGMNLAASNFLFDAVSSPKRARCAAYQNTINAVFVFIGAMLGSNIASRLPEFLARNELQIGGSYLLVIFFISGIARVLTAYIFLPRFKEVREVEDVSHTRLIYRILQFRAISGATFSPLSEETPYKETPYKETPYKETPYKETPSGDELKPAEPNSP